VAEAKSRLAGSSGKVFFIHLTSVTWVSDMDAMKKNFDESFTEIERKEYGNVEITIYKL